MESWVDACGVGLGGISEVEWGREDSNGVDSEAPKRIRLDWIGWGEFWSHFWRSFVGLFGLWTLDLGEEGG